MAQPSRLPPDASAPSRRISPVRVPVFHRWLHVLACLAIVLVVVAPLVSRALAHPVAASVQAPDAHAGHAMDMDAPPSPSAHAHHQHHEGMQGMDHAMPMMSPPTKTAPPESTPAKVTDPHADHEMGVECDYCLIAARMITLLVALLLLISLWPAVFRAVAGLVDTQTRPAPGTLGARGPPRALAC